MPKTLLARSGLVVAVVANLFVAAMCFAGRDGQTQTVTVDVRGEGAQVRVDGAQVIPDPAVAPDQYTQLEMPEAGSISLVASPSIPSLPSPQGIDSVVIKSGDGAVLFRDDFDSLDSRIWWVGAGRFEIKEGVVVAQEKGATNRLVLLDAYWRDDTKLRDYTVEVRFLNSQWVGVGVRESGDGGLYFNGNLIRTEMPSVADGYREDGTWTGVDWGGTINLGKSGLLSSLMAMVAGSYPLLLVAVAVGALVAAALAILEHLLLQAFPGLALVRTQTLPQSIPKAAWIAGLLTTALAAVGVTAYIMWRYYDGVPHFPDEVSYIFQAKLFAAARLTTHTPSVSEAFHTWRPNWLYERDGHWSTFYSAGHPLALAPGVVLGAMWLVPPMLGGASVVLIGLVGRKLYDPVTGLLAALLLAASPFFLMQSSNFMSHITWVFYMLMSMFLMLQRDKVWLFGALAGLFFALALNTRVVEAVVLMPPFAIALAWPLLQRETRAEATGRVLGFLAGGAVGALLMFLYNAGLTGDPLLPAISDHPATDGGVFGFTETHTLSSGLRNMQALLMALILLLDGWPAVVGLALLLTPFLLGSRNPWDYFCLACALLIACVYVFFPWPGFYEGPRYWFQAMPFLMLLSARGAVLAAGMLGAAASKVRARVTRGEVRPAHWSGAFVVGSVLLLLIADGTGGWLFGWNQSWDEADAPQIQNDLSDLQDVSGYDNRLPKLADEMHLKNALVLLEPCGEFDIDGPQTIFGCYGTVFNENSVDFSGDVVWAMYSPELNGDVIEAYPDREVYIATWDPLSIEPYRDEPPETGGTP
jgi:hypothetical protein